MPERSNLLHSSNKAIRMIALVMIFAVGAFSFFPDIGRAESAFLQSSEVFEKAMRQYRSSSTYIVFVTVVNDNTGEAHSDCLAAPFLLGAILEENGLTYDDSSIEKAIQIALANTTRVFHFSRPAAIEVLPPFLPAFKDRESQRLQKACGLVKQGRSVFLGDLTGAVGVEGARVCGPHDLLPKAPGDISGRRCIP